MARESLEGGGVVVKAKVRPVVTDSGGGDSAGVIALELATVAKSFNTYYVCPIIRALHNCQTVCTVCSCDVRK